MAGAEAAGRRCRSTRRRFGAAAAPRLQRALMKRGRREPGAATAAAARLLARRGPPRPAVRAQLQSRSRDWAGRARAGATRSAERASVALVLRKRSGVREATGAARPMRRRAPSCSGPERGRRLRGAHPLGGRRTGPSRRRRRGCGGRSGRSTRRPVRRSPASARACWVVAGSRRRAGAYFSCQCPTRGRRTI